MPRDTETREHDHVVLHCHTNLTIPVEWKHTALHSSSPDMIYFAGYVAEAVISRVSVNNSIEGQYDLNIINVQLSDAGTYHCIDRAGDGRQVTAQLKVQGEHFKNFGGTRTLVPGHTSLSHFRKVI